MDREAILKERLEQHYLEPDQISCISSRVRHQLLFLMTRHGPCSVRELAEYAGTYPEALYHHLKKLLKVSLFREVGKQGEGRSEEAVFDSIASNYLTRPQPWDEEYAAQCLQMLNAQFKVLGVQQSAAIMKYTTASYPNTYVGGTNIECSMDADRLEELKRRIEELKAWLVEGSDDPESRDHTIYLTVFPKED